MHVGYADPPNPTETGAQPSGVASVNVSWGRVAPVAAPLSSAGASALKHVFTRPGLYRLTVTAADRAGNAATIVRYLRILRAK